MGEPGPDAYEVVTTHTELTDTGTFTFRDVPPGDYLIIGFVVLREDSPATINIMNPDNVMIVPFSPSRGPRVAIVDEYEKDATVGEYKDYIRVGAIGTGLLYPSREYIDITPGAMIDLGKIQTSY